VINGFGGCPMTGYELLGNVNTLHLLQWFQQENIVTGVNFSEVQKIANRYPDFKLLADES